MQAIYCRRRNVGSWLLRVFTWSSWSHCGVLTRDGTVIEAAAFHGVIERPLSEFLADKSAYSGKDIALPDDVAAIAFARSQLGKPYDWAGVIGIGLHRDWEDDSAWFCDELVEAACVAGGRRRFVHDAWRVTPQQSWMVL